MWFRVQTRRGVGSEAIIVHSFEQGRPALLRRGSHPLGRPVEAIIGVALTEQQVGEVERLPVREIDVPSQAVLRIGRIDSQMIGQFDHRLAAHRISPAFRSLVMGMHDRIEHKQVVNQHRSPRAT